MFLLEEPTLSTSVAAAQEERTISGVVSLLFLSETDLLGPHDAFPDPRLYKRVSKAIHALFAKLCDRPGKIARALRKGIARFVTNKRLQGSRMIAHVVNSNARLLREETRVVLCHDTSEIDRHGRGVPDDAGPLRSPQARGYLLQVAVATTLAGRLCGAVNAFVWTRSWNLRRGDHRSRPASEKESRKWDRSIDQAEKRLRKQGFAGEIFHTADREADDYTTLANQQAKGRLLIVRRDIRGRPRQIETSERAQKRSHSRWSSLESKLNALPFRGSYQVEIDSPQVDRARGLTHAVRQATVHFRYAEVTLKPPLRYRGSARSGLTVWVVEAKEREPPPGVEPLHWQLTSLSPVRSDDEARLIVQIYKRRWKVEDYLKITKSGCQLEEQHIDSLASFERLLALTLGAANQLVELVALAREEPPRPLPEVLPPQVIAAVRDAADYHRVRWTPEPTAPQLLLTVAKIGGYEWCKIRPHPGWLVLTRGWVRVLEHQAIVTRDRERRGPS